MAVHKVMGTETEYGILIRNQQDFNPALGSALVINSFPGDRVRVQWSYDEESPGRDARGFGHEGYGVSDPDSALVNAVLSNGARLHVDHAHPEYSGPECWDPREAALHDKAGERIMAASAAAANTTLPDGQLLKLYKNNSDGKGNSYGAHENYLLARETPFGRVIRYATTFLVTRQIFTGAGKVGSENGRPDTPFQITQRADFFEEEVGLETTLKRPIVNTRDEPHADAQKYRRLHVIVGDANMAQLATFLKVGTTSLVLAMIEDEWLDREIRYADPVGALRSVSYDLSLSRALPLADGTTTTALEVQWYLLERAQAHAAAHGLEHVGEAAGKETLLRWEEVLTDLEADPTRLADRLDWPAKLQLMQRYRERDGLDWGDPRLAALDLQYHDLRPERSLVDRLGLETLVDDVDATRAIVEPPEDTRAYFRGTCLRRWPDAIVAANWDSIVFDVGEDPLRRVPMMEPSRGTRAHVGRLLERCETPAELLAELGSSDR
jgi:Pup amidohydrolase